MITRIHNNLLITLMNSLSNRFDDLVLLIGLNLKSHKNAFKIF